MGRENRVVLVNKLDEIETFRDELNGSNLFPIVIAVSVGGITCHLPDPSHSTRPEAIKCGLILKSEK